MGRRPVGWIDAAVAAMPLAAYGLMLAADALSGETPQGAVAVGIVAMGLPLCLGAWRLLGAREALRSPAAQ